MPRPRSWTYSRILPRLALVAFVGLWAGSLDAVAQSTQPARLIYYKSRSFRIPIMVSPAEKSRLKEVRLYVSRDSGYTWQFVGKTVPEQPLFPFRASEDGQYWFAVRTLDQQDRLFPGDQDRVEPSLKVVIDTMPPSLVIEPVQRDGDEVTVRWSARDEYLDLESLILEYRAEDQSDWRQVPIRQLAMTGVARWDSGTAGQLRARGQVSDRAGNVKRLEFSIQSDGMASPPTSRTIAARGPLEAEPAPAVEPIIGSGGRVADSRPRQDDDGLPPIPPPALDNEQPRVGSVVPTTADPFRSAGPATRAVSREVDDPFGSSDPFSAESGTTSRAALDSTPPSADRTTQLVASPRFPLQYEVEDAGPSGPALVELWVTRDGGRSWSRLGEDADRSSPFQVELAGDGTHGLTLVARSTSGLGDRPPAPGDSPQLWVEVDTTPPVVQLNTPRVGVGIHAGKVAISWHATDLHLGPRPVVISYRPDQPDAPWQPIADRLENTGSYVWNVPANVPPRILIRVDVQDAVGNRAHTDTSGSGSILVDRTRPRSRIIGLDSQGRVGDGPSARPMR